ncbi:Splicing factor YJU2 [Camellia lanceoleosa]|nr:Splicing factor YJU2 [Camellia lanceoleosa]
MLGKYPNWAANHPPHSKNKLYPQILLHSYEHLQFGKERWRKEGVEQYYPRTSIPRRFRGGGSQEPADEGADDASHEHSLRHLQLHIYKAYKEKQKRETEEMGDAMKSLENRTLDSKREMDILAALDEVKSMRSRQATISVDAMLEVLQRSAEEKVSEELPTKPTDHLTETRYNSKNEENKGDSPEALGDGKFIFKSPKSIRVSVSLLLGKPSLASNSNGSTKHEEHKANVSSSGLMSLCQNYLKPMKMIS